MVGVHGALVSFYRDLSTATEVSIRETLHKSSFMVWYAGGAGFLLTSGLFEAK